MSCGPRFSLRPARAAERVARDRLTWKAWGQRLTREDYLERERVLRSTDHGRYGMSTWVLERTGGDVVASCETFRLPLHPGGVAEVIASVFVDEASRGEGIASTFLPAMLAARLQAGIDALVLFSEVGSGLYERSGFRVLPSPTRSFPARTTPSSARPIEREALSGLLERRERWRGGEMNLLLTEDRVDWHLARADFYARALGRAVPAVIGAVTDEVIALWSADFKNDVLRVLEISGAPGVDLDPVIAVAQNEAARLGLSRVEQWDDAHSLRLRGGTIEQRNDDVPMGVAFTPRGELFLGPLSRACWA